MCSTSNIEAVMNFKNQISRVQKIIVYLTEDEKGIEDYIEF